MLKFRGEILSPLDKRTLYEFSCYVLDKFVASSLQKKAKITIQFSDETKLSKKDAKDLRTHKAWCTYDGVTAGKKQFTVIINKTMINRRAKKNIFQLKNALVCLGHELVHIKQYLNGEMFDYANDTVRFKGKIHKDWEEGEKYWFSPWELEAYSFEQGLWAVFKMKKLKEKSKV